MTSLDGHDILDQLDICNSNLSSIWRTQWHSPPPFPFQGKRISFYKRAQILVADSWGIMEARGEGDLVNMDWLTMFADYRVPQALVHLGVLRYSDALMQALKNGESGTFSPTGKQTWNISSWALWSSPSAPPLPGELLSPGDRREVEIRGCSIWSVELIKERLCKLVQERDGQTCAINSAIIDFYLWPYAKQRHNEMAHIPIHHTRSVYYWRAAKCAAPPPNPPGMKPSGSRCQNTRLVGWSLPEIETVVKLLDCSPAHAWGRGWFLAISRQLECSVTQRHRKC